MCLVNAYDLCVQSHVVILDPEHAAVLKTYVVDVDKYEVMHAGAPTDVVHFVITTSLQRMKRFEPDKHSVRSCMHLKLRT